MAFKKQRMGRKKVCYFTKNKIESIDYKDIELLKRFISANGKIIHMKIHRAICQQCKELGWTE